MADKKLKKTGALKMTVDDLPEISILNREIERFKKTMFQNVTHEEEESYRVVTERHFLNGLKRAREVLLLSHSQNRSAAFNGSASLPKKLMKSNPERGEGAFHEENPHL